MGCRFRPAVISALIATGLSLGLAGCGGTPTRLSSSNDIDLRNGVMDTFQYAAQGGEMLTVVKGSPFPMPAESVGPMVTAAMQGSNNGPSTTFVTQQSPATRPGYFILVQFDRVMMIPRFQDCADAVKGAGPAAAAQGDLRMTLVFCAPDSAVSWVVAKGVRPSDADDARFVRMVRTAMRNLIPSRAKEEGGSGTPMPSEDDLLRGTVAAG